MPYSLLISLALGAGWLLSPESLVIAGNSAGQMGWLTLPVLAAIALLFGITGNLLHHSQLPADTNKEFFLLQALLGTLPAAAVSLTSSIPLIIVSATALLVTSGYTFNEVFLFWFPNFGFSFLLLASLTILQFFPEKILLKAQTCFVTLTAGGLLILSLSGATGAESHITRILQQPANFSPITSAPLLLLFAGSIFPGDKKHSFLIPVTGFAIFFLWISASLSYVSPERLASSTIPYMTAAREIMGTPGRQIMGVVVISGTCAAFTSLMVITRRMLNNSIHVKNGFPLLTNTQQRWLFPPLIALVTGVLMATGLAGNELLEVLLRGALVLWLLRHTLLCISALFWIKKKGQPLPVVASICALILITTLSILIVTNPKRTEMIFFILSTFGIGGLLAGAWLFTNSNTDKKPTTQQMEKAA